MAEAKVTKIEALETYADALLGREKQLGRLMDDFRTEIARIDRAIGTDAPAYWQEQLKKTSRQIVETRDAMVRKKSTALDGENSVTEYKKRLAKLEARRTLCEKKLRIVKAAQLHWEQLNAKLSQRILHVIDIVDAGLPLARNHLEKIIQPLKAYAQLEQPPSG